MRQGFAGVGLVFLQVGPVTVIVDAFTPSQHASLSHDPVNDNQGSCQDE